MQDQALLMTPEEAAGYLGVTRRQLYRLTKDHGVPSVHIGRFLKYRRESLDRWVEEREARR